MAQEHTEQVIPRPFPAERPVISIGPAEIAPFEVDCRELRWWFLPPETGAQVSWAIYERRRPDGRWRLADATRMNAVRPALVHGVAGVEIEVDEWEDGVWHSPAWLMYGRLADDSVQWLACLRRRGRQGTLETFLDEGFAAVWGESPRRIAAGRRFVEQAAGILKQTADEPAAAGLGFYRVAVGGAAHDCLRVIELEGLPSEDGILMEAFINRDGRTVLLRRYNGRLWAGVGTKKTEWDRELPDNQVLVVDGVKYVHWYDCVTDAAIS